MKQSEVARLMYGLQEYCKDVNIDCQCCPVSDYWGCRLHTGYSPQFWGITLADIERLEREGK